MYKELRFVTDNGGHGGDSNSYEGMRANTPEDWARNFASAKKLTHFKRLKTRVDKRYKLIQKYFKRGGEILDAGCGFGEWVSYLNEKKYVATGLDYSETLINRLNATYPETKWIRGTIEKIPADDSTYDGVISWGVIEHNEVGPQAALSEFYRVLKPGGCAIVTVPFEDSLAVKASKQEFEVAPRNSSRAFFQYYMTKEELRDYVLGSGFEVIDVGLHPPAALGKVLPSVYTGLNRFPKIRLLLIHIFGIIFYWKSDWYLMVYAVGRKPR